MKRKFEYWLEEWIAPLSIIALIVWAIIGIANMP